MVPVKKRLKYSLIFVAGLILLISTWEVEARTEYDCSNGVHQYEVEIVTPAEADKEGERRYTCVLCQHTYTEAIPMYGHNWSEWRTAWEPQCGNEGTLYRVCQNSWHEEVREERILPALGHDYGPWIVDKEPTESEAGHRYRRCRRNQTHLIEETIPKLKARVQAEDNVTLIDVAIVGTNAGVLLLFAILIFSDIQVLLWARRKRKESLRKWRAGETLYEK